jgi:hypothetical protein
MSSVVPKVIPLKNVLVEDRLKERTRGVECIHMSTAYFQKFNAASPSQHGGVTL